ncbi:MAG: hypothetical protein Q8N09_07735 [Thermodesulfovibrionia bacterium]|nr:hypothetical protein [Thermodesulfovibrionia bacterium]
MKKEKNINTVIPKQVVYLFGAGSTQAEADHKGGEQVNLLMKDSKRLGRGISTRILEQAGIDRNYDIKGADIEKLISLFSASTIEEYNASAEDLRKRYYNEIVDTLSKVRILEKPELAIGLLDMHNNIAFKNIETLTGIITLNHDNLFQVASQEVHGGVNLGFKFDSIYFKYDECCTAPVIIQLHGAFNWKNSPPIEVLKLSARKKENVKNILWIPPSILKEAKDYPYNKLTGLAYELLTKKCNILRIIGCSLSQNDWDLISLIFSAQSYQYQYNEKSCFRIELIIDQATGENIKEDYSYLRNLFPIGYLTDGKRLADFKDKERITSEMNNPFKFWLKTKVQYHLDRKEFDFTKMNESLKKIIG